ncbi:MAG TPA: hypothetical protein DHV37_05775 [Erysipelotrichaceae bacterium]|nr:hypothetical protein [Erysipelotrichaceae bacterium]
MKKLSDYKDEDAILLWADLLEPMVDIVGDKKIASLLRERKSPLITAKEILKTYKKQACDVMLRIDPTPLNGLNIIVRLVSIIKEIGEDPDLKVFFDFGAEAEKESKPIGSATENIEEKEN